MKWQELLDSCSAKLLKRYPANKKEQWNNNEINVIKDLSQETIVKCAKFYLIIKINLISLEVKFICNVFYLMF